MEKKTKHRGGERRGEEENMKGEKEEEGACR